MVLVESVPKITKIAKTAKRTKKDDVIRKCEEDSILCDLGDILVRRAAAATTCVGQFGIL